LANEGATFTSETDTEVIAALIGYFYAKCTEDEGDAPHGSQNRFEWAVQRALRELHGTFGLAIVCSDFPGLLIGAKKGE
jgi:glucosamine--fructose-6-phosphate aminotransferase (isomerizing)